LPKDFLTAKYPKNAKVFGESIRRFAYFGYFAVHSGYGETGAPWPQPKLLRISRHGRVKPSKPSLPQYPYVKEQARERFSFEYYHLLMEPQVKILKLFFDRSFLSLGPDAPAGSVIGYAMRLTAIHKCTALLFSNDLSVSRFLFLGYFFCCRE
jgi:hypothetical protein